MPEVTAALAQIPPHDTLAEQAVLASMMLCPLQAAYCHGHVTEGDFYHAKHRMIFRAACSLVTEGEPVNLITVRDRLRVRGDLDEIGGDAALCYLHEYSVPASQCQAYVKILREKRVRRGLQNYSAELGSQAVDGETAEDVVACAQSRLQEIAQASAGPRPLMTALDSMLDMARYVDDIKTAPELHGGVPSGFINLDHFTGGFHPGQLIVLAARPRMGKTAMAMNIALSVAARGIPALIFSAEMTSRQLWMRAVSARTEIPFRDLQAGRVSDANEAAFNAACGAFSSLPLSTDDTPGIKITDLESKALAWALNKPRGIIFADYLQLVTSKDQKTREAEVGSVSRALKRLAGQVRMPVLALAQLNRGLEARENKRPILPDLRDSGQIEQDADVVLFLHRQAVYGGSDQGAAELIIGKQRNGECETVMLRWCAEKTEFSNDMDQVLK